MESDTLTYDRASQPLMVGSSKKRILTNNHFFTISRNFRIWIHQKEFSQNPFQIFNWNLVFIFQKNIFLIINKTIAWAETLARPYEISTL